ncbi:permease [Candidatus Margulisiibacteriota bacterium]
MNGNNNMLVLTIIMGVIAVALFIFAYTRGDSHHVRGLQASLNLFVSIIPLLLFAFIIAGLLQVLIPHQEIAKWIGAESGFRGILIGSIAGALTPGGPFVVLPFAAGLLKGGASYGTLVAFLAGFLAQTFFKKLSEISPQK